MALALSWQALDHEFDHRYQKQNKTKKQLLVERQVCMSAIVIGDKAWCDLNFRVSTDSLKHIVKDLGLYCSSTIAIKSLKTNVSITMVIFRELAIHSFIVLCTCLCLIHEESRHNV